jgi:ATP-binding cassette subfamily B protein
MRGAAVSGDDRRNWIPSTPIAFAIAVSRPYARWAALALVAVLVATAASRLMTWTLKLLTDSAIAYGAGQGELAQVWRWALVFPAAYLANEFVWRTSGFCGMRWITGAVAEGSRRLFGYLSDHSATYFADRYAGALVNKIANAASGTERLISQWLWQFFPWIVGLLADLWITNLAHPYFALGLLGWLVVYLPVNVYAVSKLHKLSFRYAEASSTLRGKMVDTTANIDTVQHTGELDHERRFIGESIGQQRVSHLREWWWSEWLLVTNGLLLAVFILAMFGIGIHLLASGRISVGSLVMVVTVVMALEQRMFFLGQNMTQAVSYHGQVAEGLAELLQPHEIEDRPGAAPLVVKRAQILFERLEFSHKNSRVFGGDFDLEIAAAKGRAGGAQRRRQVDARGPAAAPVRLDGGRILIDGQSVSEITLESLRRAVALVPQHLALPPLDRDNAATALAAARGNCGRRRSWAEGRLHRELPELLRRKVGERSRAGSGASRSPRCCGARRSPCSTRPRVPSTARA